MSKEDIFILHMIFLLHHNLLSVSSLSLQPRDNLVTFHSTCVLAHSDRDTQKRGIKPKFLSSVSRPLKSLSGKECGEATIFPSFSSFSPPCVAHMDV